MTKAWYPQAVRSKLIIATIILEKRCSSGEEWWAHMLESKGRRKERGLLFLSFCFPHSYFYGLFSSVAERFTRNEQVGNSILPRGLCV